MRRVSSGKNGRTQIAVHIQQLRIDIILLDNGVNPAVLDI